MKIGADTLETLEQRLAQLRRKLKGNRDFHEYLDVETSIRTIQRLLGNGVSRSSSRKRGPRNPEIVETAVAIMRERDGRPIRVRELYRELEERGIQVLGNPPSRNLSAKLSYSPQFESQGADGWVLNEDSAPSDDADGAE